MSNLTSLTLTEARDGLRVKKFSASEIADAHLKAIVKAKGLNAFVLETPEKAKAMKPSGSSTPVEARHSHCTP